MIPDSHRARSSARSRHEQQPLTHTPQVKRLERSSSSRVVAGVSGGLGRYFDLNPAVFRLGFVVLTLLGGAGLLVYLAAVLVIPDEGEEHSIAADVLAERRDRPWPPRRARPDRRRHPRPPLARRALAERRRRLGPAPRRRSRHPLDEPPRQPRQADRDRGDRHRLGPASRRRSPPRRRLRLVQRQPLGRRRRPRLRTGDRRRDPAVVQARHRQPPRRPLARRRLDADPRQGAASGSASCG